MLRFIDLAAFSAPNRLGGKRSGKAGMIGKRPCQLKGNPQDCRQFRARMKAG
jgi:hypothetical protein